MADVDAIPVTPIGHVVSDERDPARVDWSRVRSEVHLDTGLGEALLGLEDYSHVIVVGWLDRIPEDLRTRRQAYRDRRRVDARPETPERLTARPPGGRGHVPAFLQCVRPSITWPTAT